LPEEYKNVVDQIKGKDVAPIEQKDFVSSSEVSRDYLSVMPRLSSFLVDF
ncbi:unnamed protein product, partial [Brassica oleracea var. botrytis]